MFVIELLGEPATFWLEYHFHMKEWVTVVGYLGLAGISLKTSKEPVTAERTAASTGCQ